MILIFNFGALTAAITCGLASFRFKKHYQKTKIEALRDYSFAFFFVALAYFILALPNLILFDSFLVAIDFILVDLSFLGAVLFFTPATLSLFEEFSHFRKFVFWLILVWILIYLLFSIVLFAPAQPLKIGHLAFYWKTGIPWLPALTHGLFLINGFLISAFFFSQVKKIQERILLWRSLLIGLAAGLVASAGFLFWFFPYFYFSPGILAFSGILGLSGFLMGILVAQFLQPQKTERVGKIG